MRLLSDARAGLSALWLAAALVAAPLAVAAETAERIVAVGGAVTETVYALRQGSRLVAVDATSTYPEQADALPDVGYMRALSAEPVLALRPDLVLAVEDAGPPEAMSQIESAGVAVTAVPDEPSIEGVLGKIAVVAAALGVPERGAMLAEETANAFADLDAALDSALGAETSREAERPRVLFLLSAGGGAPLAGGQETAADGMIALAGGKNVVEAFTGYKPLSPEAMIAAAPEVIVTTERTIEAAGGEEAFLARSDIAQTPAGRNGRIAAFDDLYLLGFGPRTARAARDLASVLHPDLDLAEAGKDRAAWR